MAIKRCSGGHYYDDRRYNSCPHCESDSKKLLVDSNPEEDDKTVPMLVGADNEFHSNLSSLNQHIVTSTIVTNSAVQEQEVDKTVSLFSGNKGITPVAGWLVCIEGEEKGKDYRLRAGKNFIGRSLKMDVCIVSDQEISRDKHCSIIYEPIRNQFYLASENSNLVYCNNQLIADNKELFENDVITIGSTKLVLIPFCKEERSWKE